ncbi:AEC family transporter [Marinimicrobium alkaliphilum]|uniref:AEC family transporter n=1 Tax=Marinimicrobium alkaliphilum TaxID=2202654 RepID=UPI000DBA5C50|nr:AEC family transporter [Marinimicrobium alkaliphilum]
MFAELFAVIAPILFCTAIGFGWAKTGTLYPADFVSRLVMYIGTPCLIISVMSRVDVAPEVMGGVALAFALALVLMLVLGGLLIRVLGLPQSGYLPSLILPNNGNMGLPVCLFAFGQTGLALGLAAFLVMMLCTFTLGILLVSRRSGRWYQRVQELGRQPVLYAMVIAIYLLVTGHSMPRWLGNTVDLLGDFTIPLMLITLGVSLANLKVGAWQRSLLFSVVRVLGGMLVGWFSGWLLGLEGVALGVVILQSAMPVAILNYLLALQYDRHKEEVAAMVVISTALAFVILPMILYWVLPWGAGLQ